MTLTQKVDFSTPLQRDNRVAVPKLIRWQFKKETGQVLNVTSLAFKTTKSTLSSQEIMKLPLET